MRPFRKLIICILISIFLAAMQSGVLSLLLPSHWIPNLCVAFVLFLAFSEATVFGAFLSFMVGVSLDLCSGTLLGPWAGACSVVFGIFSPVSRRMFLESSISGVVLGIAAGLIANVAYLSISMQFRPGTYAIFPTLLSNSFITGITAPFAILVFRAILSGKFPIFKSKGFSS